MTSGIYEIWNDVTGDFYIGQAKDIEYRWRDHWWTLQRGRHDNPRLQNAFNKYGQRHFVFFVLEECPVSNLDVQEEAWWDLLQPAYNCIKPNSQKYGPTPTLESNLKRSQTLKGHPVTPEQVQKQKETMQKKKEEGWVNPLKGTKTGKPGTMLGKHLSESIKEKLRISNTGKKLSQETKDKISRAGQGREVSDSTKEKIRLGNVGQVRSDDTKQKLREAWARRKANKPQ
jgi:group I intron endonuclease